MGRDTSVASPSPDWQPATTDDPWSADSGPSPIALDELLERCLGRIEFAQRLLSRYQERFDQEMDELQRSAEAGDDAELSRIAHRLRGAAATVAAHGLQEILGRIEKHANEKHLDQIPACFAQLREEWERLNQQMRCWS